MKPRTLIVLAVLFLTLLFAALNWAAFSAPTTLNLLFAKVQAPLGVLMLLALATVTVIYLLFLAQVDAAALLESRRQAKELDKARKLADDQEASRFDALRKAIEVDVEQINSRLDELIVRVGGSAPEDAAYAAGDQGRDVEQDPR